MRWTSELVPFLGCVLVCLITLAATYIAYKTCRDPDERAMVRDASVRWAGIAFALFCVWAIGWNFAGPIGGWGILICGFFALYSFWSSFKVFYHRTIKRAEAVFSNIVPT